MSFKLLVGGYAPWPSPVPVWQSNFLSGGCALDARWPSRGGGLAQHGVTLPQRGGHREKTLVAF